MMDDTNLLFDKLLRSSELREVDFKRDQYRLDTKVLKSQLIKDILCMANAPGDDGYILLGVKAEKGRPREITGISQHHDGAELEQIVNSIIDEPIQFEYRPVNYKGSECALLHIPKSKAKPHWPKKDYGVLRRHVIYTRRSSGNREASIQEIRAMFIETMRIIDIAQKKAKSSPHVIDELASLSLDERKQTMYKMLKHVCVETGFEEYHLIKEASFHNTEPVCALVARIHKGQTQQFIFFMYPWDTRREDITLSRVRVRRIAEGHIRKRINPEIKSRLIDGLLTGSFVHVSYRNIYTKALEKRAHSYHGYWFANEWKEPWGKIMKWEARSIDSEKPNHIKDSTYEFFLSSTTSKADLKDRLGRLLSWISQNIP